MNAKAYILMLIGVAILIFIVFLFPQDFELFEPYSNIDNVAGFFWPVIFVLLPFAIMTVAVLKFSGMENNQKNFNKVLVRMFLAYTAVLGVLVLGFGL